MMKIWVNLIVLGLLRFVVPVCSNGYSEVKTTLHGMFKDKDFGESLDLLISKYKYTPELIEKSFKRCLEKKVEDNKLMACFISGLYREKVLEEHKLLLCIAEYAKDAVVTCIISCLNNYTPECFKVILCSCIIFSVSETIWKG